MEKLQCSFGTSITVLVEPGTMLLCYYNQSTALWPKSTQSVDMIPGNNSPTCLSTSTPPSGAVAVPKKTAFSQRVRPFWRDTCADLIMTLTVIGRNWLNPAHVLGWSCHFTKKYTSSFYCSNIFAYNVTQPQKIGKNRWPENVLMFFSPKTQVTGGFAKGTKLRIRCFWDLPLQFGWLFRRVWPLKMLGCLNSLTSTWLLEKYLPTKRFLGIEFSFCTCSCFMDS